MKQDDETLDSFYTDFVTFRKKYYFLISKVYL